MAILTAVRGCSTTSGPLGRLIRNASVTSVRILTSAVTVLLAVALQLPEDRLLGATNRLAWLAVAIVVVQFMWMLPTMIVGWMEPDPPGRG